MNKIFKVIWSKSKQCYVVVSEMAKNTTGKKKIVVAGILASLAVTTNIIEVDAAGRFYGNAPAKGIAISTTDGGSIASANGNNAIAIGRANADYNGAVAIGSDAVSVGNGVSMGWGATASGSNGTSLGMQTTASGSNATAVGAYAQATKISEYCSRYWE